MFTKLCTNCKLEQPLSRYYNSKATKDKLSYRCKDCDKTQGSAYRLRHKERNSELRVVVQRRHKYGLEPQDFYELLQKQQGRCAICEVALDQTITIYHSKNKLVVDHDHNTNRVRGLLCTMCNKGIGLLGDNLEGLEKAVNYLRKTQTH